MNNEETIVMQPQNGNAAKQTNVSTTNEMKDKKESGTAKRVAATAAAGVFGGAMGGAGSVAAAHMLQTEEPEVEEDIASTEEAPAAKPKPEQEEVRATSEEVIVTPEETEEPDYTNHNGADPVVTTDESDTAHPVSNDESEPEVQVLGVYQDEEGAELAILTNGSEVAAVLDSDGDGEADLLGVDFNHNNQLDEGEICDISDQHISMSQYEEAYIAQQQMEQEQQDTFAYSATDESDYNNDAEIYDA